MASTPASNALSSSPQNTSSFDRCRAVSAARSHASCSSQRAGFHANAPQHQSSSRRACMKKYFDSTTPIYTIDPAEQELVSRLRNRAPRGGDKDSCCRSCARAAKGKRLRSCASCGYYYCGRRACRAGHAFSCGEYRPHWKRTHRGEQSCALSSPKLPLGHSTPPAAAPAKHQSPYGP